MVPMKKNRLSSLEALHDLVLPVTGVSIMENKRKTLVNREWIKVNESRDG